jgi:hypothetical protein
MQVKTPEASHETWIRKSTMAYLEGEKDLNWITGIISGDVFHARELLIGLKGYGNPGRYQELLGWCNSPFGQNQ